MENLEIYTSAGPEKVYHSMLWGLPVKLTEPLPITCKSYEYLGKYQRRAKTNVVLISEKKDKKEEKDKIK